MTSSSANKPLAQPNPPITQKDRPVQMIARAALAAALAAAIAGCGHLPMPGLAATTAPEVTDGPYTLVQEPQASYAPISKLIDGAKKSVKMTIYELADNTIEESLKKARERGVDVKVLLDNAFHGQQANESAYTALHGAGIDVHWAPAGTIVHQKSIVVDDTTVVISTANFDAHYYATRRDAMIVSTVPEQVSAVSATFDGDYANASGGRLSQAVSAPRLIWSPAARADFIHAINGAQASLSVTTEELKTMRQQCPSPRRRVVAFNARSCSTPTPQTPPR